MGLSIALTLMLSAPPALAQSPSEAMFPGGQGCYLRQYAQLHLVGHPDQLVRQIALGPSDAPGRDLVLRLAVYLRGSDERFVADAYCENTGGSLSCGLEGDGGWFTLEPSRQGVKMRVGREPLGFEGQSGFVTFGGGASDDDVFLIPAVPADACP